jgi:integrase
MSDYVIRRGNTYFYRRKVPLDLVGVLERKEVTKTLRTKERAEANRRAAVMTVALDTEWAALRRVKPKALPHVDAYDLAQLEHDEGRDREALESGYMWETDEERAAWIASLPVHEQVRIAVQDIMAGQNALAVPALTQAAPVARPPASPAVGTRDTLQALAAAWEQERQPGRAARLLVARVIDRLYTLHGVIAPRGLTRAHVLALKDSMLAEGLTVGTVNQNLTMLGTVLQYGVDNDRVQANVAHNVRIRGRSNAKEARLPFTVEHLNAIFASPIYRPENRRDKRKAAVPVDSTYLTNEELPASYWLPLLALFTGARVEELGQLSPSDVYQEEGHWVVRITDEGDAQGVKTGSSRRRVPLHPALIERGLLAVVEVRRGHDRLWGLDPDSEGRETSAWGRWFANYLRDTIAIDDRRRVFHSYRHTFKDLMRSVGVTEEVSDALTGHQSSKVGRRYGGLTYPLAPLVDAVGRIRVPGLTLPSPPATPHTRA